MKLYKSKIEFRDVCEGSYDNSLKEFKSWYNTGQGYFYQGYTLKGFPYGKGIYLYAYGKVFIGYTNAEAKLDGPFTKFKPNGTVQEG